MRTSTMLVVGSLAALAFVAKGSKATVSRLERGKAYRAVFEVPEALQPHLQEAAAVLPAGSDMVVDGSQLQVSFIAPSSQTPGDIPTPFGTLRLLSVEQIG